MSKRKYNHCRVYALHIEVGDDTITSAECVIGLMERLADLVNADTIYTAQIHDLVEEPISNREIG